MTDSPNQRCAAAPSATQPSWTLSPEEHVAPSDVGEAPLTGTCPTVLWGFQKESRTFPTGYRSRVDFSESQS